MTVVVWSLWGGGAFAAPPGNRVLLSPGESVAGVNRAEVVDLSEGILHESPALTVTTDGSLLVVDVKLEEGRESLWLRTGSSGTGELGKPERVADGDRAWAPRMASGPNGVAWLAWCGRDTAAVDRSDITREVWLRRVAPGPLGSPIRVSESPGRNCDPALAVDDGGTVHLAWESSEGTRSNIVYRAVSADGTLEGPSSTLSSGWLARRPAIAVAGAQVHVAWDTLVDRGPVWESTLRTPVDPDYDVILRQAVGDGWSEPIRVDGRRGIQAAPSMVPAPGGDGVLVAYHSSHEHGLVKWWELRRVREGLVEALVVVDPSSKIRPEGEQQGAEFPEVAVSSDGRVIVVSRSSQGALLHTIDGAGVSPALDLTRKPWGARGLHARIASGPDGSVWVVRRARMTTVLEHFSFEENPFGQASFGPIPAASKVVRDVVWPRERLNVFGDGEILLGDVHMHSAISDGTGTPDEVYARAWVRGLHFASLTDHDQVAGSRMLPSEHDEIVWVTDVFDGRDGFATLHAYEWTTRSLPEGHGHRNVYFRDHAPNPPYGAGDVAQNTESLNRLLADEEAFTAPHHTSWTGTDWDAFDPAIQRHFEIASVHGVSEAPGNEPIAPRGHMEGGYAVDGLARGLQFGFLGGSDGHGLLFHHGIGRRSDPWTHGLTGVIAERGVRRDIWDALYARRTFATTGAPMSLLSRIGSMEQGAVGSSDRVVELEYLVRATTELTHVVLVADGVEVARRELTGQKARGTFTLTVDEGSHSYYVRAVQTPTDGAHDVVWSSPIFIERPKK